jgi:Tir chaperone protein (CesT) family
MSKEKINEILDEFGRRYDFVAQLNEDNICALTADSQEKVFVEYVEESDRVTVYANLFAHSEQPLEIDQLKLVMLMNVELFAKTGGLVASHPVNESPILVWGADADVLPAESLINVLLNIVELIKIVREKLGLYESAPAPELMASTPKGLPSSTAAKAASTPQKPAMPTPGMKPAATSAAKPAATPAAKPAAVISPKTAMPTPAPKPASSGNLQDMLMNQLKK